MINLIQTSLLRHFGLEKMGYHWSKTCNDFKQDVLDAITNNQMLVIPGDVGAGKTEILTSAKKELDNITHFVFVRNYYKENCTISSIINAAIYDLCSEGPKRDLEARSRQFIRIVGEIVTDKLKPYSVCIVIEEAHRLHKNTLRALKELREASYAGRSPLFSVVLIGHPELMERVKTRREVLWRSQVIEFSEEAGWMDYNERILYLKNRFGNAITNDARKTIALLCKFPLQMDDFVGKKMKEAKKAGCKVIDSEVVQPTVRQLYEAYNFSYTDISRETGIPRSTVADAINHSAHKQSEAVREAIKRLAERNNLKKAS